MSAAITFDELERRQNSVMADISQAVVRLHSKLAITHWKVFQVLRSTDSGLEDLLARFREPDTLVVLEAASPEQLQRLVDNLRQLDEKVAVLVRAIRSLENLGHWRKFYRKRGHVKEQLRLRLVAQIEALSPTDGASLILLTGTDQEHLVNALLTPAEPNEALRRAFARK